MNKYFSNFSDVTGKVETEILSDTEAIINGKNFYYEFNFITDNVLILRISDKNYFLTLDDNEENYTEVNLSSEIYNIICMSELEVLAAKMSNGRSEGKTKKEIHSPMPGIIAKLNVKDGQKVEKGEVLLVLEAMKMENEIKAARDCIIKKVTVEALRSVEKNELLIVLE
ncbi:MAG: acetyl-CoA carboxylase biotin carboxyl carrier protein subunit [Ignavibacteria bacterium]